MELRSTPGSRTATTSSAFHLRIGARLDAVEAVAPLPGGGCLPALAALVDKSLSFASAARSNPDTGCSRPYASTRRNASQLMPRLRVMIGNAARAVLLSGSRASWACRAHGRRRGHRVLAGRRSSGNPGRPGSPEQNRLQRGGTRLGDRLPTAVVGPRPHRRGIPAPNRTAQRQLRQNTAAAATGGRFCRRRDTRRSSGRLRRRRCSRSLSG